MGAVKIRPMSLGQRIKTAREARKMSQKALAQIVGIEQPSIAAIESGKAKGTKHILAIANALQQDPDWLQSGKGRMRTVEQSTGNLVEPSQSPNKASVVSVRAVNDVSKVTVRGAVQAGVWSAAAEWPEDERYETLVRINPKYRGLEPIALEVRGPSMNRVYPHNTIVICIAYIDLGREPVHGERVVVQRRRGDVVEASVKEYRRDGDGTPRLWPLSTHPDHQAPIRAADGDDDDVRITHKVISAQIDEP